MIFNEDVQLEDYSMPKKRALFNHLSFFIPFNSGLLKEQVNIDRHTPACNQTNPISLPLNKFPNETSLTNGTIGSADGSVQPNVTSSQSNLPELQKTSSNDSSWEETSEKQQQQQICEEQPKFSPLNSGVSLRKS